MAATRADRILPADSAPGIDHILLRIHEPKTRGRGAKHQSARIDPRDIVELVSAVFGDFLPSEKLWSFSGATLRRRFCQILSALGLPTKAEGKRRPFDVGSLRPGGATHLLGQTEDSELVRRRGRWASIRVMNIYLQEVSVATCLPRLDATVRQRIEMFANIFPQALSRSLYFLSTKIPFAAWYTLFLTRSTAGL